MMPLMPLMMSQTSSESGVVLTVELPDLASARDVALDVAARAVTVAAPGYAVLEVTLPITVDAARAKAKFVKKEGPHRLRVTVPAAALPAAAAGVVQETFSTSGKVSDVAL